MDMQGKTCVVTGASNGIGKETARALARRGAATTSTGSRKTNPVTYDQEALDRLWRTSEKYVGLAAA
jgi:NAD(P)-dependent dehydrogenase (short-subunit alcohol dehydrogenase family)